MNDLRTKYVEDFTQFLSRISGFGYLPRWAVFGMDVLILILATFFQHILVSRLTDFSYDTLDFYSRHALFVVINIICFIIFRTYSGIVRHSSFLDGLKLLLSTSCAFFILVAVDASTFLFTGKKIYVIPRLVIVHLLAFIMLFLFRIFVKYFFENIVKAHHKGGLQKVVIFGTGAKAIAIVNALKAEIPSRFKVVGFIDRNSSTVSSNKQMLGLPIIPLRKKVPVIMRWLAADAVILTEKGGGDELRTIVDDCLEYNFKVYLVPSIRDWENRSEISKKIKNIQIEDLLGRKPIILDKKAISTQLRGKTVLVTGAAGSIGSEIVRQVLGFKPERLIVLDQAETPLHQLGLELNSVKTKVVVQSVVADIRNKISLEQLFREFQPEVVYHAAAYKHVPLMEGNPSQAVLTNVEGTKNLADLASKYEVGKFVMVSTDKAVNPSNVMGASKRIAEKYVQSLQLKCREEGKSTKFITTRFGNVLGSNGSVVPLFTKQIANGGPLTITHPDIIRYFMTIPEACQLVLEAGAMGDGGEIYIFDMGEPVKIIDLAKKMIRLAGFIPEQDIKIEVVGLRPGEKLYEELLNDTSKTLPTHHEKIMIAKDEHEDFDHVQAAVGRLLGEAQSHNYSNEMIVSKMKDLVPEFVSKNSVFEVLDK